MDLENNHGKIDFKSYELNCKCISYLTPEQTRIEFIDPNTKEYFVNMKTLWEGILDTFELAPDEYIMSAKDVTKELKAVAKEQAKRQEIMNPQWQPWQAPTPEQPWQPSQWDNVDNQLKEILAQDAMEWMDVTTPEWPPQGEMWGILNSVFW